MSRKEQQGKPTRKREEGPQYESLVSSTIKRTLGKKMPRKEYYEMEYLRDATSPVRRHPKV
jgi:hypothetical protein